jgi:site-specific recombinase XerD
VTARRQEQGLVRVAKGVGLDSPIQLPSVIVAAGPKAAKRFLEFFTANIRNPNTRRAYARAVGDFLRWCEEKGFKLEQLQPMLVAAYVEKLMKECSAPTVKQNLAAIRMLFDYLVLGQVVPFNPAQAVRGPKHVVRKGKTPVLTEEEARSLLASIRTDHVVGLRDRALIAVMVYSFARVGAVVKMRVKDYYRQGLRAWFVLHEKGGKHHQVPAHRKAAEYLEAYLAAAAVNGDMAAGVGGDGTQGIALDPNSPLFRSTRTKTRQLTERRVAENDVLRMVKRRCREVGLPLAIGCHTFRATGITNYLEHGGTLEIAAQIAGHESTRTTQLYDRTSDELELDEIERVRI